MRTKSGMVISRRLIAIPNADAGIWECDVRYSQSVVRQCLFSGSRCIAILYEGNNGHLCAYAIPLEKTAEKRHLAAWAREIGTTYSILRECSEHNKSWDLVGLCMVDR